MTDTVKPVDDDPVLQGDERDIDVCFDSMGFSFLNFLHRQVSEGIRLKAFHYQTLSNELLTKHHPKPQRSAEHAWRVNRFCNTFGNDTAPLATQKTSKGFSPVAAERWWAPWRRGGSRSHRWELRTCLRNLWPQAQSRTKTGS